MAISLHVRAPLYERQWKQRRPKNDVQALNVLAIIPMMILMVWITTRSSFNSSASYYFPLVAATEVEEAASMDGECSASVDGSSTCDEKNTREDSTSDLLDKEDDYDCVDKNNNCALWASDGECEANPGYMLKECAKSCHSCDSQEDRRLIKTLSKYGVEQEVTGSESRKTMDIVKKTISYMEDDVFGPNPSNDIPPDVAIKCQNRQKLCAFWAAIGECEANIGFMVTNCAPSCQSCHLIDIDSRCPPLDPSTPRALSPGDLNKMFERIVTTAPGNQTSNEASNKPKSPEEDVMPNYTVTIHSQPSPFKDGDRIVDKKRDLKEDPWIITLDDFLTEEECAHLIELGHKEKYERSLDVGKMKFDGSYDGKQSETRTSENAWCSGHQSECRNDSVVQRIYRRMEKVTGIPAANGEDLQLLRYTEGQFYRPHHDYIPHQKDRQCGPRILTFFLYLSDVEEGGGTGFTDLDLVIMPKKGRALLWPSVFDSDPKGKDPRMTHEAQDVVKGTKFAANAWIHLFDFIDPKSRGCV